MNKTVDKYGDKLMFQKLFYVYTHYEWMLIKDINIKKCDIFKDYFKIYISYSQICPQLVYNFKFCEKKIHIYTV